MSYGHNWLRSCQRRLFYCLIAGNLFGALCAVFCWTRSHTVRHAFIQHAQHFKAPSRHYVEMLPTQMDMHGLSKAHLTADQKVPSILGNFLISPCSMSTHLMRHKEKSCTPFCPHLKKAGLTSPCCQTQGSISHEFVVQDWQPKLALG